MQPQKGHAPLNDCLSLHRYVPQVMLFTEHFTNKAIGFLPAGPIGLRFLFQILHGSISRTDPWDRIGLADLKKVHLPI
jgi:hypothetical protein